MINQISVISLETYAAPREGRSSGTGVGVGPGRISPPPSHPTHTPPPPPPASAAPERIGELDLLPAERRRQL